MSVESGEPQSGSKKSQCDSDEDQPSLCRNLVSHAVRMLIKWTVNGHRPMRVAILTKSVRRARLFLGSYALLFVLLALRFRSAPLAVACGALAFVGIADMVWIVFGVSARTAAEPIK